MMLKGQIRLVKKMNELDKLNTLGIAAIQNVLEDGKTLTSVEYFVNDKYDQVELHIKYK